MRIGLIGLNDKTAALHTREHFAPLFRRLVDVLMVGRALLLETCSRLELYFTGQDLAHLHTLLLSWLRAHTHEEFDHKLYAFFEKEAFLHLARVTTGLDSAIVAETEIQGQVKEAYRTASAHTRLDHELHASFQHALRIGKRVRSQLHLDRGFPTLEVAIEKALRLHVHSPSPRVFVIGASAINHQILSLLAKRGPLRGAICNRSYERAVEYGTAFGLEPLHWTDRTAWCHYDWVLCATKAPSVLIHRAEVDFSSERCTQLLIDLSVPRNVDPRIESIPILNIDQLQSHIRERHDAGKQRIHCAENLVAELVHVCTVAKSNRHPLIAVG